MVRRFKIRRADASDAYWIYKQILVESNEAKLLPRPLSEIRRLINYFFVAELNGGERVGFAALEVYSLRLAEIRSLVVLEEFRHCGYGVKLVLRCYKEAKRLGVGNLMAITGNPLFFQGIGFSYATESEREAVFIHPRKRRSSRKVKNRLHE